MGIRNKLHDWTERELVRKWRDGSATGSLLPLIDLALWSPSRAELAPR